MESELLRSPAFSHDSLLYAETNLASAGMCYGQCGSNGPPSPSLQKAGTTTKGTKEEAWRFGVGDEKDFIMETELGHLIVHSENLLFLS